MAKMVVDARGVRKRAIKDNRGYRAAFMVKRIKHESLVSGGCPRCSMADYPRGIEPLWQA